MTEILPDIHWIEGARSNLYLCVEEEGLTLIDAGVPGDDSRVLDQMGRLGHEPAALRRILLTHADMDHAGSAAVLHTETGAEIVAGEETAALATQGRSPKHLPWLVQFIVDRFMKYTAVPPDAITPCRDGDVLPVLDGLQVLATPGHTTDHYSFYSPSHGILFAGDALNNRSGLQVTPKRITADNEAARRSAIRLLQLAPAVIACGHGRPLSEHNMGVIMELFNELRRM